MNVVVETCIVEIVNDLDQGFWYYYFFSLSAAVNIFVTETSFLSPVRWGGHWFIVVSAPPQTSPCHGADLISTSSDSSSLLRVVVVEPSAFSGEIQSSLRTTSPPLRSQSKVELGPTRRCSNLVADGLFFRSTSLACHSFRRKLALPRPEPSVSLRSHVTSTLRARPWFVLRRERQIYFAPSFLTGGKGGPVFVDFTSYRRRRRLRSCWLRFLPEEREALFSGPVLSPFLLLKPPRSLSRRRRGERRKRLCRLRSYQTSSYRSSSLFLAMNCLASPRV
ncbi:hypothetical protein AALP_AA8G496700 [Arabis alpina]|uniref:Uncharacterized protein n=1 Tax=Arabis alpina TaxID=50452 RepID=A0A087GEI4_ARAAL|nr:hypothetical protein AALP_AA8G496700 [Arabis alpina]